MSRSSLSRWAMQTAARSSSVVTGTSTRAPASTRRSHSRRTSSATPGDRRNRSVADDGGVLASTLDPDGRRVELTEERWRHIVAGHPELAPHLAAVTRAIREPARRMAGRRDDEEWFYLE